MTNSTLPNDCAREFETLLVPVLEPAYRVAFHLSRNRSDAEDIVQEAALLAWRNFSSFEPGTNFRAWFHRILTNTFLGRYRAERRRGTTISLDLEPSEGADRTAAEAWRAVGGADSAEAIFAGLALEDIQAALASLPIEYRTVAVLYFVDDLKYEQIATSLGCPVGTVRSRLHRARRMLWNRLARVAGDMGLQAAV
jgi:RNA polymerase sigma-70 factor (ECF subfamily)